MGCFVVLYYLKTLPLPEELNLKDITHETVMLVTLLYIQLSNSFLIGRKPTNSARDVITADYTIIMSRSRVILSRSQGNHVMYDRSA